MPEDAKLALAVRPVFDRLDSAIHAEELMVPGQDFSRLTSGVVKEDKIFNQINKVALVTNALE